jgi:hypothetical protein
MREIRDIVHSVRARLTNIARSRGEEAQWVFERYAMERILERLARTRHRDHLVLKGAALWSVWGGPSFRPTRDLDFLGHGINPGPAEVAAQFSEILGMPVDGDGLRFPLNLIRATPIREDDIYGGVRVRAVALLGNARIPVQIDVSYGGAVVPPPADIEYPTLLGMPRPRVRAYRPETSIAEKFEAAVVLGERNGRMRDFYDLLTLPLTLAFDGRTLADAIAATFRARGTHLPDAIEDAVPPGFFTAAEPAARWTAYVGKNRLRAPAGFAAVGVEVRRFLGPVLDAATGRRDTPGRWEPGGPWR